MRSLHSAGDRSCAAPYYTLGGLVGRHAHAYSVHARPGPSTCTQKSPCAMLACQGAWLIRLGSVGMSVNRTFAPGSTRAVSPVMCQRGCLFVCQRDPRPQQRSLTLPRFGFRLHSLWTGSCDVPPGTATGFF